MIVFVYTFKTTIKNTLVDKSKNITLCILLFTEPFSSSLPNGHHSEPVNGAVGTQVNGEKQKNVSPIFEEWFHGNLSRKEVSLGELKCTTRSIL